MKARDEWFWEEVAKDVEGGGNDLEVDDRGDHRGRDEAWWIEDSEGCEEGVGKGVSSRRIVTSKGSRAIALSHLMKCASQGEG